MAVSPAIKEVLVLVTDLTHEDAGEDLHLAGVLSSDWSVTIATPEGAASLVSCGAARSALIRNAWPSADHAEAFSSLERAVRAGGLRAYNPPSRSRGYREHKGYLSDLHDAGFQVVPTWRTKEAMAEAMAEAESGAEAVFKPLDGCSGRGVLVDALVALPETGGVYQPRMRFAHEVSVFFLDGRFSHALRTAGPGPEDRWDLSPFEPEARDVAWAASFLGWNRLPYGVERIDGGRTAEGRLWLLEVEDFMPFLSLDAMEEGARERFVRDLRTSISRNLAGD